MASPSDNPSARVARLPAVQRWIEPHLFGCFAGSRVTDDEQDDLAFHLTEFSPNWACCSSPLGRRRPASGA